MNDSLQESLRTIKRNGKMVTYDINKITVAITKAFIAEEGPNATISNRIHNLIDEITCQVTNTFKRRLPNGGSIPIEDIQDQVELALMRNKCFCNSDCNLINIVSYHLSIAFNGS